MTRVKLIWSDVCKRGVETMFVAEERFQADAVKY